MSEFVRVGDLEECEFAGVKPDELQTDRQTGSGKAARNGNSRNASEVGGPIEAQEQGPRGMVFSGYANRFLSDQRRGNGSRWNDEGVHTRGAHA